MLFCYVFSYCNARAMWCSISTGFYGAMTLGGQEDEGVHYVALSLPALCQLTKLTTAIFCQWEAFTPCLPACGCL